LLVDFIKDDVTPNTISHARSINRNWADLVFLEYVTWLVLLMTMTLCRYANKKAYWRMGSSSFMLIIDFNEYMVYDRFNSTTQFHVFEAPDGKRKETDPLYQSRCYLDAFNKALVRLMEPGRYLCVDKSINQWLDCDFPNLKKIPRKPYPIGQEFKALMGKITSYILQLDTVSDSVKKKYDDMDRNLISTLKRLTKSWFSSCRPIIADSWFDSPEMISTLAKHGLFAIMQITKKRYWPRDMPKINILEGLDHN
jgi:hypothetical protein